MKILAFLIFSFNSIAWQCQVNGKMNNSITPEDHYTEATDVVFGMIMSGYFVQTAERTRTYVYTIKIFHSFKGDLNGQQIITFENSNFWDNFKVGESYLFTFNDTMQLDFCNYYFPLLIENRDANIESLRALSENTNFVPELKLKRLFKYFNVGT
jgi:hypothetical protein